MLSTKNLPVDKFQLYKLSPKWTGPFKVLQYNTTNQNVSLDYSHFPELSNIRNKLHTSLLKPFTPNDDIYFLARKQNRLEPVEEVRWQVAHVREFRSPPRLVCYNTKSNGKDGLLSTINGSSQQIWMKTSSSNFAYMVARQPPINEVRPINAYIIARADKKLLT